MNYNIKNEITTYLQQLEQRHIDLEKTLLQIDCSLPKRMKVTIDRGGRNYYSVLHAGEKKYRYLGGDNNEDVQKIKATRFLELSISESHNEIKAVKSYLKKSGLIKYEDLNNRLSKAYRGAKVFHSNSLSERAKKWRAQMEEIKSGYAPYRPAELIHKTHDNTMVRSKGEALIYNYLLEMGISFVYELPIRVQSNGTGSLLLPDFTILSEFDFKSTIFLEHQGKMDDYQYRNKFSESVYKYWSNGYIPERDVFFTFDLPNGGFDDSPILNIIKTHVRP